MIHEGEILKNFAKVQKGGITALEKALELSRSGLRYYLDRQELDEEFKERVAKLYGTNVPSIWVSNKTALDAGWEDITDQIDTPLKRGDIPEDESTGQRMRREKATGEGDKRKIPLLGEASAGTDEINTAVEHIEHYIDVGDLLRDSEAAFTVYGNSMTPAYPSGAQLGLKRNYDGFIQPGETYVVVTKSNRVFKRLYLDENNPDVYICYSDNTMMHETGPRKGQYAYPPFHVHKRDVISIYDVVGMIKRNRNSNIYLR